MNKAKAWIKAMRLRTLPLSFSCILLGGSFAYEYHAVGTGEFNWLIFILILCTTLFLQILSNFANDFGDALKGTDNENRVGPERAIQSGAISKVEMRNAIVVLSLLSLTSGVFLLQLCFKGNFDWRFYAFLILGFGAIAAAIKYTVGKTAYGYSGLGDLFVFIFFGLVGVGGTLYLLTQDYDWMYLFPGITMGCFSVAVLNLNNMRDIENDSAMGKRTIAVILDKNKAKIYHYILFLVAYLAYPLPILSNSVENHPEILMIILPIAIVHCAHLRKVSKIHEAKDFDPELKKIALSALAFSMLHWIVILSF